MFGLGDFPDHASETIEVENFGDDVAMGALRKIDGFRKGFLQKPCAELSLRWITRSVNKGLATEPEYARIFR